jgi:hypothetical protein
MKATNPKIDTAQWNDTNLDGFIDQVVLRFDSIVNVDDVNQANDGLTCIEIRNGTDLVIIDSLDYTKNGTDTLIISFKGDSIPGTGIYGLSVNYKNTSGGSSISDEDDNTAQIADGSNAGMYIDRAEPVALRGYYRDGHPDEGDGTVAPDGYLDNVIIEFSEEIKSASFSHNDIIVSSPGDMNLVCTASDQWTLDPLIIDKNKLRWTLPDNPVTDSILSSGTIVEIAYEHNVDDIMDNANNYWGETKNDTLTLSDGAAPYINNIIFNPADGDTVGIGDTIEVDVQVRQADSSIITPEIFNINGVDIKSTFDSVGNGYCRGKYVVSASDSNINDGTEAIPVEIMFADSSGNSSELFTNSTPSNTPGIDLDQPVVQDVIIPDNPMKIGDTVSVTILVADDGGDFPGLVSGNIGGYTLDSLTRDNATSYSAIFVISNGGKDYSSSSEISVNNLVLADNAGNENSPYSGFIDQPNDPIDANAPVITSVSIPDDTLSIGDIVADTIQVEPDGGDFPNLTSGIIGGNSVSKLFRLNDTIYVSEFTISDGGMDYATGDSIPVDNIVLTDDAGNVSVPFYDSIAQNSGLIDANKPLIKRYITADSALKIGDTAVDTIIFKHKIGVSPSLISGTYGGYTLSNFSKTDDTTYTVEYTIDENGNSFSASDDIQLSNLKIQDGAGNISNTYDTTISQSNDPVFITKPTASLSGEEEICEGDSALLTVNLTGTSPWNITITEGTSDYDFSAIDTNVFKVYTDSAGVYEITSLSDSTGNSGIELGSSVTVSVNALQPVSFSLDATYSLNDPPVEITSNSPKGGTFSGPGVTISDSTFHPDIAGTENSPHTIRYTYIDDNGCSNFHEEEVSVVDVDAYISSLENYYCYGDEKDTLYIRNVPDTATILSFSIAGGNGLTTLADDTTGVIDPSVIGYGNDTIIFKYEDGATFTIKKSFTVDSVGANIDFVGLNSAYCEDEDVALLNAVNLFPSGGTGNYNGPSPGLTITAGTNSNSANFDPTGPEPDSTYTIEYYYTAPNSGCQSNVISKTVQIDSLPAVSFNLKSNYNKYGGSVELVGNHPDTGYFSGNGVTDNILYPELLEVQTGLEITYTYTDSITGCTNQVTNSTDIKEANVDIEGLQSSYCYDSTVYGITVSDKSFSNGQFFGKGIDSIGEDTANYTPAVAGKGYDTVVYQYYDDATLYEVEKIVYVDSIGEVDFTGLSSDTAEYCAGSEEISLTGINDHPDGVGEFSFTGNPTTAFSKDGNKAYLTPTHELAQSSPYEITYTYSSNLSGCSSLETKQIYIHSLPEVSFTLASNYNIDGGEVQLSGNHSPDGQFSGGGVVDNYFYPDLVGGVTSNHPITYTFSDTITGCSNDTTIETDIYKADVSINGLNSVYCYDSTAHLVTVSEGSNSYNNGEFIGEGLDSVGIDSVEFTPAIAGEGYDTIIFRYFIDTTEYQVSKIVRVDSIGNPQITNLSPEYCTGNYNISINGITDHPDGSGQFSFSKTTDAFTNGGNSAILVPVDSLARSTPYTVTYTYTSDISGCSESVSRNTTIHPLPYVEFDLLPNYNVEREEVPLEGNYSGGSFSGPGVFQDDAGDYFFSPKQAKAGDNYNITYSYTDANGCQNDTVMVTNVATVDAQFVGLDQNTINYFCFDGEKDTIVGEATNSNGDPGFFSGDGITDLSNDTAIFDPAIAGEGTHVISYEYIGADDTTRFEISAEVFVDMIGEVRILGLDTGYCEDIGQVTVESYVNHTDGTHMFYFSDPDTGFINANDQALITPSEIGPSESPYTLEYEYTSYTGCKSSKKRDFYIHPLSDLSYSLKDLYNMEEAPDTLKAKPAGGYFSGKGIVNDSIFQPEIAGVGNWDITYSYTNDKGCLNTLVKQTEVQESSGEMSINDADQIYCYDAEPDTLYATPENSDGDYGTFTGDGITDLGDNRAVFDPSKAGDGEHEITFEYTGAGSSTKFYLKKTLVVDSLGDVDFLGLSPGFCKNDQQVELTPISTGGEGTGVFYGKGVLGDTYIPADAPVGLDTVSYVFTSSFSQCKTSKDSIIEIHDVPDIFFNITDECISEKDDSTKFVNYTESIDPVVKWEWDFGDLASGQYNTSSKESPYHLYTDAGEKTVGLQATTDFGCTEQYDSTFTLGTKSIADFTWMSECYSEDSIKFVADDDNGKITDFTWSFGDEKTINTEDSVVSYLFSSPDNYKVKLSVYSVYGCQDSVIKTVPVRPYVSFSESGGGVYFEDFESGGNGWVSEAVDKHGINTWKLSAPQGSIINEPPGQEGNSIWYTEVNYPDHLPERSHVTSPCFDFTNLERPMVKLDIWRASDQYRDGANMQYTIDGGNTWNNIGTADNGINWYNYTRIAGEPGGEKEGWSVSVPDTTWKEARNNLDVIAGQDNIQFRITYGSDGNEVDEFEGFAFDNIWIGDRTRKTVLEHFTSINDQKARNKDKNIINTLVEENKNDVIDIKYHTAFSGANALNSDYPAGPSARSAFYGVSEVPYTIMDGMVHKFNYEDGNELSEDHIRKRILQDPYFSIEPVMEVVDSFVKVETQVTSLFNLKDTDVSLYTMVLEKTISGDAFGENPNEKYKNTVKAIMPNPGGKRYIKDWNKGDSESVVNIWKMNNVYNTDNLQVVVFIQDNNSSEIYQSAVAKAGSIDTTIVTGINYDIANNSGYTIYPNPAENKVHILFDQTLKESVEIKFYNNIGKLVKTGNIKPYQKHKMLGVSDLQPGLYIIKMHAPSGIIGVAKIYVLRD